MLFPQGTLVRVGHFVGEVQNSDDEITTVESFDGHRREVATVEVHECPVHIKRAFVTLQMERQWV